MTEIQVPTASGGRSKISRVEAVDLFKFYVLFFMIQGHLFRAYLLEPIKNMNWYGYHEILHGIVAPSFLFSAGFAVFLSYYNKKEHYSGFGKAFFDRIRRTLFVVWIGYWIHLPFFSLIKSFEAVSQGKIIEFLRVDILQCIGVSVLIFTFLAVLARNEKILAIGSGILALLFFFLPSLTRDIRIWHVIDPYFDYRESLFPLFPWAGYLFLGVITAFFYAKFKKETFFKICLILGLLTFPWYFFQKNAFYLKAELTYTGNLNKIGGILLLLWISNWVVNRFKGPVISLMKKAAKESLFVYAFHLFLIFNFLSFKGLKVYFFNRLNVWEATGLFILVQAFVFALSLFYNYLKEKKHRLWAVGFYLFWAGFVLLFILRPY